jgi:hypothetical protein
MLLKNDGHHSTVYCNGWTNGHIATWNTLNHNNINNNNSDDIGTREPDKQTLSKIEDEDLAKKHND